MSIRKHVLKHINETSLLSLDDEISFEQSENTMNKAANDGYLKMLYDFKNCKKGDLLYYHNELGFNLSTGRKEFDDDVHIYGRCVIPYDGKSVTFTFIPYLDICDEKTWYEHVRSGNRWTKTTYRHVDNADFDFSIKMADYLLFEEIYKDTTGLLNKAGYPENSEFGSLPLIHDYDSDKYWVDQQIYRSSKVATAVIPQEVYVGKQKYAKEVKVIEKLKSEKHRAIYIIKFTWPKRKKKMVKESVDFNSLLQMNNDVEFEQSQLPQNITAKALYDFNKCDIGDILYYDEIFGYNIVQGREVAICMDKDASGKSLFMKLHDEAFAMDSASWYTASHYDVDHLPYTYLPSGYLFKHAVENYTRIFGNDAVNNLNFQLGRYYWTSTLNNGVHNTIIFSDRTSQKFAIKEHSFESSNSLTLIARRFIDPYQQKNKNTSNE